MLTINATKKDGNVDNAELREEGKIPAVFYGPKEDSTSVVIDEVELLKVYREAGESTVITVKEGSNDHEALIHEIQWDAVTQKPVHVDFYVIEKGKKIEVSIPLEFVGESKAETEDGGVLVKVMHELDIEAMPKDLPQHLEVDITPLVDFEAQIKAGDIKLPEGVELKVEADEVVALVQEPREEEEEPETEMDLDSIEVEGEKKEEGEEGASEDSNEGGSDDKKEE
jgi:large subunit ribosomal protein L25